MAKRANLFVSYAHEDAPFLAELMAHLRLLERLGLVKCWHDQKVVSGREWRKEISDSQRGADIVVLLLSSGAP